jgi:spermidine synthase
MVRAAALLLTLLTGFSGLVYEVAWQKYLATLLGSHSEATAAVLAIFLGGMAVGYEVFGRVTHAAVARATAEGRAPALLRIYGLVESGIGLWALAFPWLFDAVQRISFWIPSGHEGASFAFDVLLCALLLGPPTVLMGGTIPVLTQALSRSAAESTRVHAWIYATNTAGAFAGALAGGFALIPWLGLDGVLRAMGVVNLSAGLTFVALQRLGAALLLGAREVATSAADRPAPAGVRPYLLVAFLGGFAMMALQTVANRIGALSLGSSHFTFAMIASLFVLCIALGSFAVAALPKIPRALIVASLWALVALVAALYLAVPSAPYAAHVIRVLFRDLPQGFGLYHAVIFVGMLVVLAPPIALSGALLPLLFHHLRDRYGDLGQIAGRLYSANTIGSLVGALLGGYLLLFWLDLSQIYRVALGALALSAAIVSARVLDVRRGVASALCGAVVVGSALLPAWNRERLTFGAFRTRQPTTQTFSGSDAFYKANLARLKLLYYRDDPIATISVSEVRDPGGLSRSIFNNGKSDSNTGYEYSTLCLLSLLPAWLTDDPSNAFIVGWGTGISAGELARLEGVRRVHVAEISPGVIDAAPLFAAWNLGAHTNSKVAVERRDGYRALLRSGEHYGVILSEPSNPWVTGVEMLYSREFLEAARDHLTPGGVFAQWMHTYETDANTLALVMQTYASVFDQVAVWYTASSDLVLLGFRSEGAYPPVAALRERFEQPAFRSGFGRCGTPSWNELASHEILPPGVLRRNPNARVHTLRHPLLANAAAHAFFAGGGTEVARLPGSLDGAEPSPRGLLAESVPTLDDAALRTITHHVCESMRPIECATWYAFWTQRSPSSKLRDQAWPETAVRLGGDSEASRRLIESLGALYRGEVPAAQTRDPMVRAQTATALFARYYVHSIPFPRGGVQRAWSECQVSHNPLACLDKRREAEARLTALSTASTAAN